MSELLPAVITYARNWASLAAVRSLGERGVAVHAGDEYRFAAATLSKFCKASFRYPNCDTHTEAFIETLVDKLRTISPDGDVVYLPIHRETFVTAEHRERIEPHCRLALPSAEAIDQVHDKGRLAEHAQANGLPTPPTLVARTRDAFVEKHESWTYPAFLKIRKGAAAVGLKKVDSPAEALETFDEFVETYGLRDGQLPILQAGVAGTDYCAAYLFANGESRAAMAYHNLKTYPHDSGMGVVRESVDAPRLLEVGRELLASLNWHGPAEIDFRWTGRDDDEPLMLEVNPRFWGGMVVSVASGIDFPWMSYCLARDGDVEPAPPPVAGVKSRTPLLSILSTAQDLAEDANRYEQARSAYESAMQHATNQTIANRARALWEGIKAGVAPKERQEQLRAALEEHEGAVNDIIRWDDPGPLLCALFPLAVFVKHGKVTGDLLVSEGEAARAADEPANDETTSGAHA